MPSIFCLIKNILLFQLITCIGHLTVNVIQTSIVTWCDLLTNIRNFQCVHFVCAHAFWVYVKPTAFCHCSNVVCLKKYWENNFSKLIVLCTLWYVKKCWYLITCFFMKTLCLIIWTVKQFWKTNVLITISTYLKSFA